MQVKYLIQWNQLNSDFLKKYEGHFQYMDKAAIGAVVTFEPRYVPRIPGVYDNVPEKCYPEEPEHVDIEGFVVTTPYAGFTQSARAESRDIHLSAYISGRLQESPDEFIDAMFEAVESYIESKDGQAEISKALIKECREHYYENDGEDW